MRFLDNDESDDPMLSVVNLIDLFLVIIGVLMIVVMENPLNPLSKNDVIVVENPGKANMRIMVKEGEVLKRYESNGEMGEGQGARAGITYRMSDGKMIYVPEGDSSK